MRNWGGSSIGGGVVEELEPEIPSSHKTPEARILN